MRGAFNSKLIAKGILDLLIGTTFQENNNDSKAQTGIGFSSNGLLTNIMAASTQIFSGNSASLYHYEAVFGRIAYVWDGKYIVNFTGRRDGSSRFGPNRQFGNFGAIGVAWVFSKEKVIQDNFPFLSFGKLRASYGITGNDQIGDYQFLSTYSPNGVQYQGIGGLFPTIIPNPYFEWERVRKLEGGIEIGLLKDAILTSLSYYRNMTDNQLIQQQLPALTGFRTVQANFPALIQNSGWEFTIHSKNWSTLNFVWTSDINLAISRNRLLKFDGIETSPYKYSYKVGQSLSGRYMYHYIGINPQTGVYKFQTKSGDGVPTAPDDWFFSKPITQHWFGGVANSFKYKGIQLDIFIQIVSQLGYNYKDYSFSPGTAKKNQPTYVLDRWQKPGNISSIQRFSGSGGIGYRPFNYFLASDGIISDASFVRVKNISLSYNLPSAWLKKAGFENSRIFLQCQNLFTISNYQGLDPETQGLNLPPLRTITGGVQIVF